MCWRGCLGRAENDGSEPAADCNNEWLFLAKPEVVYRSFTQGANPLDKRRCGF